MKKINITNKATGRSYQNKGTRKDLMEWFTRKAPKGHFGKPERWLDVEEPGHIATREIETEDGTKTQWFYEPEYSFEIIDISEEVEERDQMNKRMQAIEDGRKIIAMVSRVISKASMKQQTEVSDHFVGVLTCLSFGFFEVAKSKLEDIKPISKLEEKIQAKILERL